MTAPAESASCATSFITAGTADERLPKERDPSIKLPSSPVMGFVSTPWGTGTGIGSGIGAGAGSASTSAGAVRART